MKLHIQKGKRMNQIIRNVRDELKQAADDKTKKASKSFSGKKSNARESKRQQLSKLPKNIFPKFKGWAREKHLIYATNCLNLVIARRCGWRLTGRDGSAKIFNQMILRFLKRGLKNISATGLNVILCAITLFVHLLNNIRNTLIT